MDQAALLPSEATVSVTASPAKGIEATIALCEQLQAHGFRAVPHVSARMIRDRAHLADLIAWLEGAGVDRAFVVGGDAKEPGAYPDGLSLLREMADIGHPLSEIGIPGYPQGHAFIADGVLLEALRAKAEFASYITTQLCFDPGAIASWISERRMEGITLPVHVGIPASLPGQERPIRDPPDPVRWFLPPGRASRGACVSRRRSSDWDQRSSHLHVQRGRRHRIVAALDAGIAHRT
jgi:methylenetetrahydrofolate reductase (NADPH)